MREIGPSPILPALAGLALSSSAVPAAEPAPPKVSSTPIRTARQVTDLINSLEVWFPGRDYSEAGRKKLIEAGRALSRVPRKFLEDGFRQRAGSGPDFDGKAYLLMRVIFKLPASLPRTQAQYLAGYTSHRVPESPLDDNHWRPSWPLVWKEDRLVAVGVWNEHNGPGYRPEREFRYFCARFKRRTRFKD